MSRRPYSSQQNRRGFVKASLLTPANIAAANLTSWFRADSGVTLNTTTVSSWADKSSAGILPTLSQGTGAAQPTFTASGINGKPDMIYDGARFLSGSTTVLGTAQLTLFGIFKSSSIATQFIFGMQFNSFQYSVFLNQDGTHNGQIQCYIAAGANAVTSPLSYADGNPHAFIVTYDGANMSLYVDGTTAVATTGATGTISNGTGDKNSVGSATGAASNDRLFIGDIPEVGSYNIGLSASNVASLMAYLKSRDGN